MAKPQRIPEPSISKAINSLLKWFHSQPTTTSTTSASIYLILTLKSIPHLGRSLSFSLPIPHPFHHPSLILSDHNPNLPSISKTIHSLSLPISITPFSHLEEQQPLQGLFLVDRRIIQKFKKSEDLNLKKKGTHVVELDFSKRKWVEEAKRAVGCTLLKFRGGTCCGIEVGRVGMEREEILENVMGVVEAAVEKVPRKWRNVRSVHVKMAESVALPIYDSQGWEERERGA